MSNSLKVVAISSNWHGAGKSTVAKALAEALYGEIISLASPIKEIAYQMGWDGNKDEKGRRLLQTLGTECGRNCIGKDVWVNKWLEKALASDKDVVICDDLRFQTEYEFFKFYTDCRFVHIVRPSQSSTLKDLWRRYFAHESERGIDFDTAYKHPHVVIINDYTSVHSLQAQAKQIAETLFRG